MADLPITVTQCPPQPEDVSGNLRRLTRYAAEAADAGSALLVLPEMFLTGYALGSARVNAVAESRLGRSAESVAFTAQRHAIAIAYGYPERVRQGDIYNAVQIMDSSGDSILNHRKSRLFGDLDRRQFCPAIPSAATCSIAGWRIAVSICYEVEFPEHVRAAAMSGADAVIVPTANMTAYDAVPTLLVPARAYENHVYVAYANYVGSEGDILYGGRSRIAGPDGVTLAAAGSSKAVSLHVQLSRRTLTASRNDPPYLADLSPARHLDAT